ncbi:unnamed protein product [Polarella glacialis]|uniref:Uncharacterized protein n=1 Tax=Polarella glacialis TaxID=89957 RepID=A0A813F3T0_POLGL|nr:unnamed protein product [Polarella glacialis]
MASVMSKRIRHSVRDRPGLLSTIFTTSISRHPQRNAAVVNVRSIAEPLACSQIYTSSGPAGCLTIRSLLTKRTARLLLRSFRINIGLELENCDNREEDCDFAEEAAALPQTPADGLGLGKCKPSAGAPSDRSFREALPLSGGSILVGSQSPSHKHVSVLPGSSADMSRLTDGLCTHISIFPAQFGG